MLRLFSRLGVAGVLAVLVLFLALTFGQHWTYARLTHETLLGEIYFKRLDGNRYAVTFFETNRKKKHQFELTGDQLRLDARVLKWHAWAALLGKDPLYQLERISGRYADPAVARYAQPSLYTLVETGWFDPWNLVATYPETFFMADASYGSSVYLPMTDDARYYISLSASGLLARHSITR